MPVPKQLRVLAHLGSTYLVFTFAVSIFLVEFIITITSQRLFEWEKFFNCNFSPDNTRLLRYLLLWKSHIVQHSLAILKSDKSHVKGSTSIVVHFKQWKPGVDLPWKNNIVWSYNRLTLYSLWNSDKLYTLQLKM